MARNGFVFPVKVARSEVAYQITPAWDVGMFGEEVGEQGGDIPPGAQEEMPKEDVPVEIEMEKKPCPPMLAEPVFGDMTPLIMEEDQQWETHAGIKIKRHPFSTRPPHVHPADWETEAKQTKQMLTYQYRMDKWREQMQQLRSDGKVDVVAATPAPGCMGVGSSVGKSVGNDSLDIQVRGDGIPAQTLAQYPRDGVSKDYWVAYPNRVVRVHVKLRKALFPPESSGCPVDLPFLSLKRETRFTDGTGDWRMREDLWKGQGAHEVLGFPWLGETTFLRKGVQIPGWQRKG